MRAKVLFNSCIRGAYYKLTLKLSYRVEALPGQFFMIRPGLPGSPSDPLLPRPFSIHRSTPDGIIEILYQIVGKGTTLIAHTDAGEEMEVLGPLGNGFDLRRGASSGETLIVAGGMGVAPMLTLAEALKGSCPGRRIVIFLGGRSAGDLLCVDELEKTATELILATEDGSAGVKGYVTESLEKYLTKLREETDFKSVSSTDASSRAVIYACGPSPMLQRISEIAGLSGLDTYFSLEAVMACGIGLCMGCAVKRRNGKGYYLVCTDGPVFRGESVDLGEAG